MGQLHFETYREPNGDHRWRLVAANGNTMADSSEGYRNHGDMLDAIDRIRGEVADAPIVAVDK